VAYEIEQDERLREAVELSLASIFLGLIVGALLVFAVFSPLLFSGGHGGNYLLAKVTLPFAMLGFSRFEQSSVMLIALIQFPCYGVVMAVAHYFGRTRLLLFSIFILHAAASCVCFAVLTEFT
jgi:multidrug efflux pump subunit AcrB